MTAQLAFDLSEPLPDWNGTPLAYHEEFATIEQHATARARWHEEHDPFTHRVRCRMWGPGFLRPVVTDQHTFHSLNAECRSDGRATRVGVPDHVPHALMYQALCEPCRWHMIATSEREIVEAWHDHAFPGWRDLKVMSLVEVQPESGKPLGKKALAWIAEHYGDRPQGHPIWTERSDPIATRHVDGRSPWGGFDLGYHREKNEVAS